MRKSDNQRKERQNMSNGRKEGGIELRKDQRRGKEDRGLFVKQTLDFACYENALSSASTTIIIIYFQIQTSNGHITNYTDTTTACYM